MALYNLGVTVNSHLNLEEIIWSLYKESSHLIDTSNLAIVLHDDKSDTLAFNLLFERGQPVKNLRPARLTEAMEPFSRILSEQTPLLIQDSTKNKGAGPIELPKPVRSWLGAPISNPLQPQERAQGVIAIWSYEPDAFTEHDLWLLSAIGTQAAIAIRDARLYETVLAERDRVVEAEEQARKQLAYELHDGPTQLVSAIAMQLDFCQLALARDPALLAEELAATQKLARQALHTIRTLLFELRPLALETKGLLEALKIFLERRQEDVGDTTQLRLNVQTSNADGQLSRQEEKVEGALFAIVQETVNNALKHARAGEIVLNLRETSTTLYLTIADNGQGFDVERVLKHYEQQGSLGMFNIWERADLIGAELDIQSAPGSGARITVSVPKSRAERLRKRGATGPLSLRK